MIITQSASTLQEVKWEAPDRDRYEGILIAKYNIRSHITGEGLFTTNASVSIDSDLYVIIQTAYHRFLPTNNHGRVVAQECEEERHTFSGICQLYLRQFIEKRMHQLLEKVTHINRHEIQLHIKELGEFEIVDDFDYITHMLDKMPIVRFLAMYQYSKENLDILMEEYTNQTVSDLLMDDRIRKCVEFMGDKGEEVYQLVFDMTPNKTRSATEFLDNIKKMINFYF